MHVSSRTHKRCERVMHDPLCKKASQLRWEIPDSWHGHADPAKAKVTSCISFCSKSISAQNTLGIQWVFQTFGSKSYIMYFILFKKYPSTEYLGYPIGFPNLWIQMLHHVFHFIQKVFRCGILWYPTGIPDLYIQKLHHVFILFQNNSLAWNTLCIPWVFQTIRKLLTAICK